MKYTKLTSIFFTCYSDLPMNKLSELFNVNHFIVCQVNPHVIPFLQKANTPSKLRQAANFCMHMAKTEAQHRCTQVNWIFMRVVMILTLLLVD